MQTRLKSRRGVIDPVTLSVICALALGYVLGGWKPMAMFKPTPPTEQLTKLQSELEQQTKAAEKARIEREAAVVAERAKLETQVKAAQRDALGAGAAIERIPNKGPEALLGSQMISRASIKLALAVGKLPESEQAEMVALIDGVLSGKQAEVDAARAKLAEMDAQFRIVTAEREAIKAELPKLAAKVADAEKQTAVVQGKVVQAENKLKDYAIKADEKDRHAGSLMGQLDSLRNVAIAIGAGYIFLAFILPGLLKHLEPSVTKDRVRAIAGYLTSPLLFHDAAKKINDLTDRINQ